MSYFINWAHAYSVHFGVWVTFVVGCTIYRDGAPSPKKLPGLLESALAIAAILSVFSSHSHVHYISFLTQLVK